MAKCKCFTAILPDTAEARRLLGAASREGRDCLLGRLAKVHDDDGADKDCAAWIESNPSPLAIVTVKPNTDDSTEEGLGAQLRAAYEAKHGTKKASAK